MLGDREFIVVGEYDPKPDGKWPGLKGAVAVATQLAAELSKTVTWALPPDSAKDVRSWLREQKLDLDDAESRRVAGAIFVEEIEEQRNEVTPEGRSSFPVLTGQEIMDRPPPDYQIEELWPENSLVVLYGQPGSAKSFVALSWELAILNGSQWMRRECQQGQTVYIATEGVGSLGERLRAWEIGNIHGSAKSLRVITVAPRLHNDADTTALLDSLRTVAEKPTLVVIDTMARTLVGGDENSAQDVGQFVAATDRIRNEFDCTVLVVHHSGKDDKKERGSSALRGAADVIIKAKREDGTPMRFALTCEKAKDAEPFQSIVIELEPVETRDGVTSCYVTAGATWSGPRLPKKTRKLLEVLRTGSKGSATGALTSGEWETASGFSKTAFKSALKDLKIRGLVQFERDGCHMRYWLAEANKGQGPNEVATGSQQSGRTGER